MYKDSEQSADEMQTELRDFLSNIKTDTN